MSQPQNPETVILKNRYYSQGIKEIDIWNYYMSARRELLKQVVGRDLMIYLMLDKGPTLIRRGKSTKYIRLNHKNYEDIITGRTISIHSTMRRNDDIGIIDIDSDNFRMARIAALDVFDFVMRSIPIIDKASIRYTGKTGFHVACELTRRLNIDSTRFLLRKFLLESDLAKKYTVESRRRPGVPNLDLAPNKFMGGFISLHSLSIEGLKCMEVHSTKILSFDPNQARIKIK